MDSHLGKIRRSSLKIEMYVSMVMISARSGAELAVVVSAWFDTVSDLILTMNGRKNCNTVQMLEYRLRRDRSFWTL